MIRLRDPSLIETFPKWVYEEVTSPETEVQEVELNVQS